MYRLMLSLAFSSAETVSYIDGLTPVLGVQVTELVDGVFVGITASHVAMDGTSLWHFLNSWAEIARGADVISKFPVFDPWFLPGSNRPIRLPPIAELVSS